jgi:hypothetical protein
MKLLGIVSVDFDVTDQLMIRISAFVRYWRKNGSTMRQYISSSFTECHSNGFKRRQLESNVAANIAVEPFGTLNTLPLPRM